MPIDYSTPSDRPLHDEATWSALFQEEETVCAEKQPVEPYWSAPAPPTESSEAWQLAQQTMARDQCVDLQICGYNKGGLLVHWHHLQGFVPASQLINFPQFHLEAARLQALKKQLHHTLTLKFVAVDPAQNRLILSERAILFDANERDNLLHHIQCGDIMTGEITNLTNFGAFVDLGGIEGLIHISELTWSRVSHPSQVVSPGQPVEVQVLTVDTEKARIALSLKQLRPDPWAAIETRYQSGQIVQGTVSNVVSYGAFVQLEDELEGLIHISELAEESFLHPRHVVRKGEKVMARVLLVNGPGKRLALSLRQVNSNHSHQNNAR